MARFPKLKGADPFPHFATVNPYERREDFDYSRYDYTATIKLCRVSWTPDYRHTVNWESASARDAYFADIDGEPVELQNGFVRIQTERINVPVPLDVALTYNYVWMQVPQLTQASPIDYETSGIRSIGAFVTDAIYYAPSSTELVLAIDYWTTYLPHLQVQQLYLDRGHAPMWAMSASEYLSNPLDNSYDLLTPDVNYGERAIVRDGKMLSTAQSSCVYVLATTIPYASIDSIPTAVAGVAVGPTWSDTSERFGHQLQVNGYTWEYGYTYDGMRSPNDPTHYDGNAATGYYYYGLLGSAVASGALQTLLHALPPLATTCAAMYVVPQDVIVFGNVHTISGVQLHEIGTKTGFVPMGQLSLSVAAFGYPDRYKNIAKLYTMPYASIELSDDSGQTVSIAIESIAGSTLDVVQRISAAFPFLSWQALAANVANASGASSYVWHDVTGTTQTLSMLDTGMEYAIELGIPTYQLLLDAATSEGSTSYIEAQQQREQARVAYQNAMRSANTARENTIDADATAWTNTASSADTALANTRNTGQTQNANAASQNNTRTLKTARNNQAQNDTSSEAVSNIFNSLYLDDEYTMQASDANLKSEAVAGALNTVMSALSGNGLGAVSTGLSAIVNISTDAFLSVLSSENIEGKEAVGQDYQTNLNAIHVSNAADQTAYDNDLNSTVTSLNVATANTNAQNVNTTTKANATRTRNTSDANATYSRSASEANAKSNMIVAQDAYLNRMRQMDAIPPVAYGSNTGEASADAWRTKGVHMRIVTQSDSAISRAGDAMLRYGYRYEGLWNIEAWCPDDRDYCYWQAGDVFANAAALDNPTAEGVFERIMRDGTTVWNDPEKIGAVML